MCSLGRPCLHWQRAQCWSIPPALPGRDVVSTVADESIWSTKLTDRQWFEWLRLELHAWAPLDFCHQRSARLQRSRHVHGVQTVQYQPPLQRRALCRCLQGDFSIRHCSSTVRFHKASSAVLILQHLHPREELYLARTNLRYVL